jgi:hypothetical protein
MELDGVGRRDAQDRATGGVPGEGREQRMDVS